MQQDVLNCHPLLEVEQLQRQSQRRRFQQWRAYLSWKGKHRQSNHDFFYLQESIFFTHPQIKGILVDVMTNRGWAASDRFGAKQQRKFTVPKNEQSSVQFSGRFQLTMAASLLKHAAWPFSKIMLPKKVNFCLKNSHFKRLSTKDQELRANNTFSRSSLCCSSDREKTKMLSI